MKAKIEGWCTLTIKTTTKEKLIKIKEEKNMRSLDEVINCLIKEGV